MITKVEGKPVEDSAELADRDRAATSRARRSRSRSTATATPGEIKVKLGERPLGGSAGRFPACSKPSRWPTRASPTTPTSSAARSIEEIRELAEPLKGRRVVHLSATAFGGGVSEILYTLVPLMRDVGLEVEWQVIYGREEFFNATKIMHNALQGNPQDLTEEQWATWSQYNEMNARELSRGWDVCIVHDPQPAALLHARAGEGEGLGVALPHRRLDPEPGHDEAAAARTSRATRSRCSTSRATSPRG